jgi:hypothetical protein|tara:strand:+ start:1606 stop:1806 length:201 start_codon:yes stop_codon:yes gene_type:complete
MWGSNKVEELYDDMQNLINDSQSDVTKFVDGNKSAGTRIRKVMQTVKALAQEVRLEVQDQKNKGEI